MTTETITQTAIVTPTAGTPTIGVSHIAVVTPVSQVAQTIEVAQIAIVAIDVEYQIPTFYTGFRIPALWGHPLFVQKS